MNLIGQLLNNYENVNPWKDLKIEFHLKDTHKIYWLEIIVALPKIWKDIILKDKGNTKNLVIFDHLIFRNSQIFSLHKLTSKELYLILVDANTMKRFENLFETSEFNWKKVCFLIYSTFSAYVPV